jgi:hypothetical protein
MATALNSETFLLKEGTLSVGTWTNPEDIGTNATSPLSFFSGNPIGYVKQGTINIDIPREYAEFLNNTPGILIRKDLIRKQFAIEGENGQFDGEVTSLLKNTNSQLSYAVTIPSAQTWDLMHMGSDEPVQSAQGFLLETELTNGDIMLIGIYAGRLLTEDNSIALSGTEHAVQPFRIDSFVHPGFDGVTDEAQKHYGLIAVKTA